MSSLTSTTTTTTTTTKTKTPRTMEIQLAPEAIDQTNAPTLIQADDIDTTFRSTSIDLVSASLGSTILAFSDEWFAAASNLLNPLAPIRQPGKFTFTGAWYDGWETRRHNANYDWVVVRLGVASGRVRGVEIDTAHFNGNHAPEVSVEGVFLPSADDDAALRNSLIDPAYLDWQPILPRVACGPNTRQAWLLPSSSPTQYTHVRLRMYPDGGIARFRLYGSVVPVLPLAADVEIDMAAAVNGGLATSCSDQHFGTKDNLLLPGRGKDMGDGWETKRTRGEHVDWTIVRLGVPGSIKRVVVDTAHYRGNFPQAVEVYAAEEEQGSQGGPPEHDSSRWVRVVAPQRTMADKEHEYTRDNGALLADVEGRTFAYAKLVIIPDGGVKRFRVFGCRAPAVEQKAEVVVTDK